jgi:PncC family amidohydrolase
VSNEPYPAGVEPDPASPSERHPDTPAPDPETSPWNVPNALTAFRIVLVPVFAWMLLAHPDEPGWRLLTAGVFTLAILTDSLDGYLARRHNLVTKFGKLADPIADKALTGTALICLSVIGELWWWATVVILVREWGITILRFAMLRYGVMAAGRGQDQDVRAGHRDHPLPAAARGPGGVVAGPGRGGDLGRGGRDGGRRAADRGHRTGLPAGCVPAPSPEPVRTVNLSPAARVLAELQRRDETVATAESLTGGLLGVLLTAVPGASAGYVGGVISYATRLKETLAGVDAGVLATSGPVAGRTAAEMAAGVARRCVADWGVATTGVAGPEPQDGHPVGEVYVAVAHPASDRVEVRGLRLTGDRPAIREVAAAQALDLLATCLDVVDLDTGVRPAEPT